MINFGSVCRWPCKSREQQQSKKSSGSKIERRGRNRRRNWKIRKILQYRTDSDKILTKFLIIYFSNWFWIDESFLLRILFRCNFYGLYSDFRETELIFLLFIHRKTFQINSFNFISPDWWFSNKFFPLWILRRMIRLCIARLVVISLRIWKRLIVWKHSMTYSRRHIPPLRRLNYCNIP